MDFLVHYSVTYHVQNSVIHSTIPRPKVVGKSISNILKQKRMNLLGHLQMYNRNSLLYTEAKLKESDRNQQYILCLKELNSNSKINYTSGD